MKRTGCLRLQWPISAIALTFTMSAGAAGGNGGGGGGGNGGGAAAVAAPAIIVTQEAQLLAGHAEDNVLPLDNLGTSPQALSGDTAVFLASGPLTQAATRKLVVYHRTPNTGIWSKQAELKPSVADVSGFGSSIALEGDILVAAVYNPPPVSFDPNRPPKAVYVYHRAGNVWTLEARLTGADAATDTFLYGYSVAVNGNRVLVGAAGGTHLNGTLTPDTRHGAIYEFERTLSATGIVQWRQTAKLVGGPAKVPDRFGGLIAFNGDTVVIGGPANKLLGGANTTAVYQRGAAGWPARPTAILRPADLITVGTDQHGIGFGGAVGINRNTIVIGGAADVSGAKAFGSAYVFLRTAGVWRQEAKLAPKSRSNADHFGQRVSVSGDYALFGYRPNGASAGRVTVFKRVGTAWGESTITSPGIPVEVADRVDNFGTFALVDGTTGLISQTWATLSREWSYRFR